MGIENRRQLENTRKKLQDLERFCAELKQKSAPDPHRRDLSLRSLSSLIKQFKEEIARYECHVSPAAKRD